MQFLRGFTIVELMITVTVISVLLTLGLPSMSQWLQNVQIRTAAESVLNGVQLARSQAVQRNVPVYFTLVTDLTSACKRLANGPGWVVSLQDPTNACNQPASDTTFPQIIQKKDGTEGVSSSISITAIGIDASIPPNVVSANAIAFNGIGRVVANGDGTPTLTQVDVTSNNSNAPRAMRVVMFGANLRMCDPALAYATDPRGC